MDKKYCPVCHAEQIYGGKSRPYVTSQPIFYECRIASCICCKSAWVPNPPSVEQLRNYYDKVGRGEFIFPAFLEKPAMALERCQALVRWRFVIEALDRYGKNIVENKIAICDIGAGYGCTYEVSSHFDLDVDYFAYESSAERRKKIEHLNGHILGDFFSDQVTQQYDLVWASHILEHYPDPDFVLQRMKKIMKPDGAAFLEVPCLDHEFKSDVTPHLLFFNVEGLKKTLERNGFRILNIDSVGSLRQQARQQYNKVYTPSLKKQIRELLPKSLAILLRLVYRLFAFPFRQSISLSEDLKNRDVFEKWQLETYGGDRCWIRAVFVTAH